MSENGYMLFLNEIADHALPNFESDFNYLEETMKSHDILTKSSCEQLITFIDLTTLCGDDTKKRIESLVNDALNPIKEKELHCAAICVYPARILDVRISMENLGNFLPIASVACGFPSGQYHFETRLREIELAIHDGATEIDAVINRALVLDGDWKTFCEEIYRMKNACSGKAKIKVILSTGELINSENIYKASLGAMFAGADFIKTSTGKEAVNATLESAAIMCHAIKHYYKLTGRKVGFKPAGGIRTVEEAHSYRSLVMKILGPEWANSSSYFRIGASRGLLENIRDKLNSL